MSFSEFRPIPGVWGHVVNPSGKILRYVSHGRWNIAPIRMCKGYRYLTVPGWYIDEDKAKSFRAGRLICSAFHGPAPFLGACARHLNDIKDDDRAENLMWGTLSQNSHDAIRNGRMLPTIGEAHGMHKLRWIDVDNIRKLLSVGARGCDLALKYNVSRAAITMIKNNKNWRITK